MYLNSDDSGSGLAMEEVGIVLHVRTTTRDHPWMINEASFPYDIGKGI